MHLHLGQMVLISLYMDEIVSSFATEIVVGCTIHNKHYKGVVWIVPECIKNLSWNVER